MNGNIKKYIYIIGGVFVLFVILRLLGYILPWLIAAGAVAYVVTKIVKFISRRREEKQLNKHEEYKEDTYNYSAASDDYTNGEIIDVEYEEVGSTAQSKRD